MRRHKILFLCTGNACRSQMSVGWTRFLHGDRIDAYSAGVRPAGVDPRAVLVMREAGVDISRHTSKHVDTLIDVPFDLIVTVCDAAAEACPVFPHPVPRVHRGFQDPPAHAARAADEAQALDCYRRVRDEIRDFVLELPALLKNPAP